MTVFVERHGDLLDDDAHALVNPVNCVGAMGRGVALQMQRRWPNMFESYKRRCESPRGLEPGQLHAWLDIQVPIRWIINFPTKDDWRHPSRIEHITEGLKALRGWLAANPQVHTIAIPALGCGHGGLKWERVEQLIRGYLGDIADLEVRIYPPQKR